MYKKSTNLNQYCFWSAKRQKRCTGAYFAEGQHQYDGILRDRPPCIVAINPRTPYVQFRACFRGWKEYTLAGKLAALSRNEARVKRQSNVFGQARESGAARLSFAPPPALAGSSSSAACGRVFISPADCCRRTTSPPVAPFKTRAPPDHCRGHVPPGPDHCRGYAPPGPADHCRGYVPPGPDHRRGYVPPGPDRCRGYAPPGPTSDRLLPSDYVPGNRVPNRHDHWPRLWPTDHAASSSS